MLFITDIVKCKTQLPSNEITKAMSTLFQVTHLKISSKTLNSSASLFMTYTSSILFTTIVKFP